MAPTRLDAIIEVLAEHRVDFIIVGGVSGVLQGAPLHTDDLDIVYARSPDNLDRLLQSLVVLGARFRDPADRRIVPTLSHLASAGHKLLITKHGPLDTLATIGKARAYEDLISFTDLLSIGTHEYRVLRLEKLIETKEEAGREKDRLMLPILRRTLEEKRRAKGSR